MRAKVSDITIREALARNAKLVAKYGDTYLPTALRLEAELKQLNKAHADRNRVLSYAKIED